MRKSMGLALFLLCTSCHHGSDHNIFGDTDGTLPPVNVDDEQDDEQTDELRGIIEGPDPIPQVKDKKEDRQ